MTHLPIFALPALGVLAILLQSPEANQAYQRGREALDASRWQEAIDAFEEAGEDEALADAALYWQARAHARIRNPERALELVAELESRFPRSSWRDDAQALAAEIRRASPKQAAATEDDDLKLMALNGLLQADEEAALPILEELFSGERSPRLKERALFVLAQSDSEEAHAILAGIARDEAEPDLQRQAIRYLGVHSSDRGLALLAELYSSLKSTESRSTVLESFMIADDEKRLLDVARTEPDTELRGKATQLLGAMGASAELGELFQRETSDEVKKRILQGFMVAGDDERLLAVARDRSQGEELRKTAIQLLGAQGANEALWQLYREESGVEIKKDILRGLFVAGEHERIAEVATNAGESLELRKAAIHDLGVSGEEAVPALLGLYRSEASGDLKREVLNALFIQSATPELIAIAREEKDPGLKREAVEKISLIGSPEAREFLMELLRK